MRKIFPETPGRLALLPSCLCLDAPFVAVSWSLLLGHFAGGALLPANQVGLFCAAWLIYLGDRLFDVRKSAPFRRTSLRHRFADRHRKGLLCCAALAVTGGIASIPFLERINWILLSTLCAGVVLYVFLFRLSYRLAFFRFLPLKEFFIGTGFALGVFLAADVVIHPGNVGLFSAVSALFMANCLLISLAEQEEDRMSDPASFSARGGKWPGRVLAAVFLCCWLLVIGGIMNERSLGVEARRWIAFPYSLSLGGLVLIRARMDQRSPHVQALADGVLLFPLPFVLVSFLLQSTA